MHVPATASVFPCCGNLPLHPVALLLSHSIHLPFPLPVSKSATNRHPQALSTLGMLLGSGAAALAYRLSGGSYEVTFCLSAVAAAVSLLLVIAAFGGDAKAGARARRIAGGSVWCGERRWACSRRLEGCWALCCR